MKSTLFLLCILFVTDILAQEKYISITNFQTGKEVLFKQDKRVRIKTVDGKKLNGKLQIINEEQIMIKKVMIPLSDIEKIKNNPLALNLIISGGLIYIGLVTVGLGGYAIGMGGASVLGISLIGSGSGLVLTGILSPNFLPAVFVNHYSNARIVTLE